MNKSQILQKIAEAILAEERAMPIYTRHIESTLYWSGLRKDDQKKITEMFLRLKKDSDKHIAHLKHIQTLVSEKD